MKFIDKDLVSIQEARILLENSNIAKKSLLQFSQNKLNEIVELFYEKIKDEFMNLAKLSVEETGYGNIEDEYNEIKIMSKLIYEEIIDKKYIGVLKENNNGEILEVGIPLGTIVAICPSINPATAVINIILNGIKTGNTIIFAPTKRAEKIVGKIVEVFSYIAEKVGLPEDTVSCLTTSSRKGVVELINSESVDLIINIGLEKYNYELSNISKPQIYGATGASPVFIERTANIQNAVKNIIDSRKFNNGILPGAEQFVVADITIASKVKEEMKLQGAYFMTESQEEALIDLILKNEALDEEYIGKSAEFLAKRAGFNIPEGSSILVSEQKYISDFNPYSKELKCPIISYYVENDWINACEKCLNLLFESKGHTLAIYSNDSSVIKQFIMIKPVARILVNTGASLGAMGITSDLFPSVILGGLTTGLGFLEDNLNPTNLRYTRKVGYGEEKIAYKKDDLMDILKEILNQLSN
ncbi:MAG: aldehyde dehydrogenase family protein [Miniphocaeibacter sp.]|uniref:aldehyde dehydrogenase family protein n=1 Tax=Miniphocaeibacter sp. TaxID=3100973 RepID=UPI00181A5F6F|nr:aldehyde dehydrogenase family protein [Gallicola sp.]